MFLLKKRYWLTATVLIAILLVIIKLPATWVIYAVQKAAPNLQVSDVSGTLWSGQAKYSQWFSNGHTLALGKLDWQIRGLSLLMLNPCVNFSSEASNQYVKGLACVSLLSQELSAEKIDVSLPVAKVAPFFNVNLEGVLDGFVEEFVWKNNQLEKSDLSFLWQRASVFNGNQWIPLGDIQGRAKDDGQGSLTAVINHVETAQQIEPPVSLNLEASISELMAVRPKIRVQGTVAASAESGALRQMLQLVGEPLADGSYQIDIRE